MGLFDGKTPTERNKIIAAGVLGVVSLFALYMAFGRSFFGSSTATATTKSSPTPKPAVVPSASNSKFTLPTAEQEALDIVVPVVYRPGNSYAPDPGRNIFAFYEPPPPTPYVAPVPITPTPAPPPVQTPAPTPVFLATSVTPQSVYAGSKGFKLEVFGDRFVPSARIYFNQTEMPTTFVSPQQLSTNIPDNLIAQEGPRQIIIQTPDGLANSFPVMMIVLAPPQPSNLQFIGMIGRKRYNNDTAYFLETGKQVPFGARLNDVVAQRFRLINISEVEVILEDVTLGFKHRIAISGPAGGQPSTGGFIPFNPGGIPQGAIPGNPNGRTVPGQPPNRPVRPPDKKDDVDDNDGPDDK